MAYLKYTDEAFAHCEVGKLIGVKGRLQTHDAKSKNGNDFRSLNIIAESISYL